MAEDKFDLVVETAKKVFEVIKPLPRWEQEIALDVANNIRAHYWVMMPEAERARLKHSHEPSVDRPDI
jgi:hypothetical protein